MFKLSRGIMWSALAATGLWAGFSILGSFNGAEKARQLFNSMPLKIYWFILVLIFIAGFVEFPRLLRKPPLLFIHAGCLLVLAGAMFGSASGHRLAERFLGIDKLQSGYMVIDEGQSENSVVSENFDETLGHLPFSIRLNDFRIEYYESDKESLAQLNIETGDGQHFQLVAGAGEEISLGGGKNKLKVVRTFTNFKINIENGEKIATDEKGAGENPAVEIEIERPDGTKVTHYVFERFVEHFGSRDGLQMSYISQGPRSIRDYFSDVTVIKDEKEIISKTIEVNHPLHYGGYHFYQHSYDSDAEEYTVLSITSDSGLYVVYSGYWLLSLGVLCQFWFGPIIRYMKSKQGN